MNNILLFLLLSSLITLFDSFKITRSNFIKTSAINFFSPIILKNHNNNHYDNHNALVISCDKVGKSVLSDLKKLNIRTAVTTTKPARADELSQIANDVIIIPQMEINTDEAIRTAINNNDVIIIADTISIFSIHTFVRTCKRIANAITANKNNKKTIILISSINVYGIHTDGAYVNELNDFNDNNDNHNSDTYWHINHNAIAKLIKIGENYLLDLMKNNNQIRTVVLRTSTIVDHDWAIDIMNRNFETRNYTTDIGNTYMSISIAEEISNCINWIIKNDDVKGVFNLVSDSYKRRCFYDKLFNILGKKEIKWVNVNDNDKNNYLNKDFYYSMDENLLLPNTQRFNMRVDHSKIIKKGYNYKYKDIWKYNF